METFLYIVFFLSCLLLIVSVLLQPGKTDAGALFTSNVSSAALNPRGTQSVLSKLTIAMATTFMLSALMLSLPALTGRVSVLDTQGEASQSNSNTANTNADVSGQATGSNSANAGAEKKSGAANTSEKPAAANDEAGSKAAEKKPEAAANESGKN